MSTDLIEQIYDAALEAHLWPGVLAGIADACGAVSATLVPGHDLASVIISPGAEASQAAYAAHWWQHDIIAQAIFPAQRRGTFCDWMLIDAGTRARHPFYQEFRRAFDIRDNIAFAVEPEAGLPFGVSLQLPDRAPEPPDMATVDRFTSLGRHVGRAMLFAERARTAEPSAVATDLLAALACGAACLDASGRVLLVNAALAALASDGLRVVGGHLCTADPADQAALDRMIRLAVGPGPLAGPELVPIHRRSGRRALLAGILPISPRRQEFLGHSPPRCRAVLTVTDPDARVSARTEAALHALGLSPAEARLAALVGRGLPPRAAARELGLTEGTVRTRLKQVFDKLAIGRQSDLARLVTQLSMLRGP